MFMVTHGSYSDYSVDLVTFSRRHAERVAKAMSAPMDKYGTGDLYPEEHSVEEVACLPEGKMPKRRVSYSMMAELMDGKVVREWSNSYSRWEHEGEYGVGIITGKRPRVVIVKAPMHGGKGARIEITGNDSKLVEKSYQDRLRMFRAGSWRPDYTPGREELKE